MTIQGKGANPEKQEIPDTPEYNPDTSMEEFYRSQGRYGRMHSEEYSWDVRECTREAFGEGRGQDQGRSTPSSELYRSIRYHTNFLPVETAKECIQEIGKYNYFDPVRVNDAINSISQPIRVAVGREGTPCLYIWTNQPTQVAEHLREIYGESAEAVTARGPDELGTVETYPAYGFNDDIKETDGWTLVRAWWD